MSEALLRIRYALAGVVLLGVTGCPGQLENADEIAALPVCPGNIDVQNLFIARCGSSICHGSTAEEPAGNLELTSPGLPSRLIGHESEGCKPMLLVDPANPDNSYLLGKITEPPAGCGDRMPLVGRLTQNEIACVRSYLHRIVAESGPVVVPPDAGTDAGTDANVDGGP